MQALGYISGHEVGAGTKPAIVYICKLLQVSAQVGRHEARAGAQPGTVCTCMS